MVTATHPGQQTFFGQLRERLRSMSPEERAEASAHRPAREAEAREERLALGWPSFLRRSGVPARALADLTGPVLGDTLALEAARAWIRSSRQHLLLTGWTGTGKTVAACWALRAAARQDGTYAPALFLAWGRLVDAPPRQAEQLLREAAAARVLVLDDVGLGNGERLGDRERRRLEMLADARDAPGRHTIWTTNLAVARTATTPSPFAQLVGPRVTSRLGRSLLWRDCGRDDLRRTLGGTLPPTP